jgi:hypothetical protein
MELSEHLNRLADVGSGGAIPTAVLSVLGSRCVAAAPSAVAIKPDGVVFISGFRAAALGSLTLVAVAAAALGSPALAASEHCALSQCGAQPPRVGRDHSLLPR